MKVISHQQMLVKLRARIAQAGSQKAVATSLDISEQYLSDVLAGRRFPGQKIASALGYKATRQFIET